MNSNKVIGAGLAVFAGGCLLLTGWIIHKSGVMQGATADGQWALGLAAIAVHLSLAICGLAMFASRKLIVSLACGVMMLGAALCSAWQITSFLATEVISVTKARELREKRETARVTAALDLAKQRQQTQAEILRDELKWSRGTSREVDGRRERKDLADTRAKLITEIGKAENIGLPDATPEAAHLQAGLVAQWVARKIGWDETALEVSPYLLIALMLLLVEVLFWPLASYFWHKPPEDTEASVKSSAESGGSDNSSGGKVKSEPATVKQDEKVVNFPAAVKAEPAQLQATGIVENSHNPPIPKVSAEPPRVTAPAPKPSLKLSLDDLDGYIASLKAGTALPNNKQLAETFGTSPPTMSRKMRRKEGRGEVKRERVGRHVQTVVLPRRHGGLRAGV